MAVLALCGLLACFTIPAPGSTSDGADSTERAPEKATVRFRPVGDQQNVPERYRLEPHEFDYQLALKRQLPDFAIDVYELRFPSPVTSPYPQNNTVHAEYYRPRGKGPFPGIVVLDILGGDQNLSRTVAMLLAQNQIASLFVQMAYYGPRRPADSSARLISPNYPQTMDAIRQTVLDVALCRRLAGVAARDRREAPRHPRHQPRQLYGHLER